MASFFELSLVQTSSLPGNFTKQTIYSKCHEVILNFREVQLQKSKES